MLRRDPAYGIHTGARVIYEGNTENTLPKSPGRRDEVDLLEFLAITFGVLGVPVQADGNIVVVGSHEDAQSRRRDIFDIAVIGKLARVSN